MKKVYFVRHGQVQSNVDKTSQDPGERLTELGEHQAEFVAKRCKELGIDTIISSSYERALQTAQAIEMELSAGIVISDLFIETKQPHEYVGRKVSHQEMVENYSLRQQHIEDPEWRYSNEENFFDIKKRAIQALKFIENREEDVICVVTHGEFLRAMMATLMMGNDLTPQVWLHIRGFIKTTNTGITFCTYNPESTHDRKWELISWNDHAHLGNVDSIYKK